LINLIIMFLLLSAGFVFAGSNDKPNLNFKQNNQISWDDWKKNLKLQLSNQFSKDTLMYLESITFNKRVIELDRKQPEFTLEFEDYLSKRINNSVIKEINNKFNENNGLLDKLEHYYEVDKGIILSLWSIETAFGKYVGKFDIIRSLASLAYDGRRKNFFLKELSKALQIIDDNHLKNEQFRGSWAGAFGQTQFMPSTFESYAVDFDNDGKKNLFNKVDALASAANYLSKMGWIENLHWGEKVKIPPNQDLLKLAEKKYLGDVDFWTEQGIILKKQYDINQMLRLVIPDSNNNFFLVTENFDVILKWNRSNYFALTVFLLADEVKK